MSTAAALLIALLIDALVGWPRWLFARIGHPVTWLGRLIEWLDRRMNRDDRPQAARRIAGLAATLIVTAAAALAALAATALLPDGPAGVLIAGLLAWPLVAARSMHDHVQAVAAPLDAQDVPGARAAVAMIVGRDTTQLDPPGISRAALESLGENSSDGFVAPVFWGVVLGLPGIAAYKAINTLDSMIGHRTARHEDFGKAAARLDDLVNLIPARLTGVLFALVSGQARRALRIMAQDAGFHRSPNAGWPEAAMAGALDVRLSGPRIYGTHVAHEPWLNGTAPDPQPRDLGRGLVLFRRMVALVALLLAFLAVV